MRVGKWNEKEQERNTWRLIVKEAKTNKGCRAEKKEEESYEKFSSCLWTGSIGLYESGVQ
jgi:hypothetical protein